MHEALSSSQEFQSRHIGPNEQEIKDMLGSLGFGSLEEMADKVIPKSIRSHFDFEKALGSGMSEANFLASAKTILGKNKVYRSLIGMGFHDCHTPTVILRNVFENPQWYTAYTPYQPEISQGRLEALLNFQTMVMDLTAMEIANASLLDEGTAAAEALNMAFNLSKNKSNVFLASSTLHPHVLEVLKTRSEPMGWTMQVTEPSGYQGEAPFAVIVSYPDTFGRIHDYKALTEKWHSQGALVIADVDLLSLTLLKPPGEWGADIVVGNSQRFGVPLGNGGPHAAFMATRDAYKRLLPGRLVGLSVDSQGKKALRLTLQTREQHIRREKATSNICTSQVLLANMASMYAVYHGPKGLRRIAERIHRSAQILAKGLHQLGYEILNQDYFDSLSIQAKDATAICARAQNFQLNLRLINDQVIGISLDETTDLKVIESVWQAFSPGHKLSVQDIDKDIQASNLPTVLQRSSSFLQHEVFNSHHSETEMLRYITRLQSKDLTLAQSMIPLGSCTMKLNATSELLPVSWPETNRIHPFAPADQMSGYLEMIKDLESKLSALTGFAAVSLQPNAGSQGEYAGLLVIRKYLQNKGQAQRNICLIPSSAHGTNPASAVMAGFEVKVVQCDENGNVDVKDLRAKAEQYREQLAALMITYPSTHGVFEESIKEICEIIHQNGAQVYMDGANLNALVGLCRPGEFGPDVAHMNLHKTFAIPHGGGGPGVGPIGVAEHLKEFLPSHSLMKEAGPKNGITATTSAPFGSASILPISWAYISMMGAQGLRRASLVAILNANYLAKKLSDSYPILYKGREGLVAHECILDLRSIKKASGVDVTDVAKRLMDFGFHSPTMSWPVVGTLMVEPTESEDKAELDRFVDAMEKIRQEIKDIELKKTDSENNLLKNAPHTVQMLMSDEWNKPYSREQAGFALPWLRQRKFWPAVGRVDNAYGDKNVVCACPPMEDYQ